MTKLPTTEKVIEKIKLLLASDSHPQAITLYRQSFEEDHLLHAGYIRYDILMYLLNKYFVPNYLPDEVNNALRLPLDGNDHKEQSILQACSWLGIIDCCDMEIVRGECSLERNINFIMDMLDLIYSMKGFNNNTEELKQQFTKDHNFINHICHNKNSVMANDMKLFSNEMSSKFKKKKLPDLASFKADVERANLHIQRYQGIIEDLQANIDEQHRGQSVVIDEQTLHTGGNYYIMPNLSIEHHEKIQQLGETTNRFCELVDQFMHVYHEEFAQWITPKPVEEKSQLEDLSVSIPQVLVTLETFIKNVHQIKDSYQQLTMDGITLSTITQNFNQEIQPKLDLIEQSTRSLR